MCILPCETLQVPNLLHLRAFRGGSLQIRDTYAVTEDETGKREAYAAPGIE
jgi:hypothetical protein